MNFSTLFAPFPSLQLSSLLMTLLLMLQQWLPLTDSAPSFPLYAAPNTVFTNGAPNIAASNTALANGAPNSAPNSGASNAGTSSSSRFLDNRPRCGVIESAGQPGEVAIVGGAPSQPTRRFFVIDSGSSNGGGSGTNNNNNNNKDKLWPRPYLTYRIATYSRRLPTSLVDDAVSRAFGIWSSRTPFRFTRVVDAGVEADIVLSFASRFHGDRWAFDGPRGVLAHAFRPNAVYDDLSGDVHFDDDEDWTVKSAFGINLMQLAAHEIGHRYFTFCFMHIDASWAHSRNFFKNLGDRSTFQNFIVKVTLTTHWLHIYLNVNLFASFACPDNANTYSIAKSAV